DLVPPAPKNTPAIAYPDAALALDPPPRGTVIVQLTIGIDGVPRDLSVVQSVSPELDAAALEGLRAWRWTPATYRGQAVEIETQIPVELVPLPPPAAPATPEPT